jgi:transposase
VVIEVVLKKGQVWGDPTNATKRAHINGWTERQWHHLDTTQAVCTLTRLSWSTVNAIMASAVERGMLRRTEEEITYLRIDEKSSERGHTYASILTDIERSRVLDLVTERKLVAAVSLLEALTPAQRISVKAVAMHMWPAYMRAARQCQFWSYSYKGAAKRFFKAWSNNAMRSRWSR